MPAKIYYRTCLPKDILDIIGMFAGSEDHRLVFTLTPKRKFLGKIMILSCEDNTFRKQLRKRNWIPIRLVSTNFKDLCLDRIRRHVYWSQFTNHGTFATEFIMELDRRMTEIIDFGLKSNKHEY